MNNYFSPVHWCSLLKKKVDNLLNINAIYII